MERGLLQEAIKLNKERKRKKRWNQVVRVLAGIVVFCTTYALILPAITLEKQPICGIEEHAHTEICYQKQIEKQLQCPYESGELELHEHDEACYAEVEVAEPLLVCTLTEHEHEDVCYPLEKKSEIITMIQNAGVMAVADDATVSIDIKCWSSLIPMDGGNQITCPVGSTLVIKIGTQQANYVVPSISVNGGEIVSIQYSCDKGDVHNNYDWCPDNLLHTITIKITGQSVQITGTVDGGQWSIHNVEIINGGSGEEPDNPVIPPEEPEEPDDPVVPDSEYKSVITGSVHINRLRFYNLCENGDSGVSALAGCVFEIRGPNGYIETVTSRNDAEIELPEGIPDGDFTITEISVPEGYLRDTRYERSFTIKNGVLTSEHNIGTFINHNIEQLKANKTAEVEDYNNRIYEILLTAESHMRMYQMDPVDMLFVVDQSNSMLFPAGLNDTGKSVNLSLNGNNNIRNMEALNLDKSQMYYLISDPAGTSTVWSLWYENGTWLYQDTSYFVKAEQNNAPGYQDQNEQAIFPQNRSYQAQKDSESPGTRSNGGGLGHSLSGSGLGKDIDKAPNDVQNYKLYTAMVDAETKEKYNRLHYLEEALSNMIYALADINPENRVTLTGFTKTVDEANDCIGPLKLTSTNAERLVDAVRSINTSGGTRQDIALKHIYENHLNDASKGYGDEIYENYTILITDGAPVISSGSEIDNLGGPNDAASTTANSVYAQLKGYANAVKNRSSLMTVGLGMESVEAGKQVLREIASGDSFYCALDDASELVHSIQAMLFEGFKPKASIDITGDVEDEISDSFYPIAWIDKGKGASTGRKLLVEGGTKDWILLNEGDWITLEGKYTTAGASDAAGQLLKREDGTFYVVWKNQTFSAPYLDEIERIAWVEAGEGKSTNRTVVYSDGEKDWILLNGDDWISQDGSYYEGTPWIYERRYFGQIKKNGDSYSVEWGSSASGRNRQYCNFEPWEGIVYVKAREDFIGGNAIETNKQAKVVVDHTSKHFETPTVNVHLLGMNEMNSEITVYLGDLVNDADGSPLDSLKYFYENTEFTKLISDGGNVLNKYDAATTDGLEDEVFSLRYAIGRDLTEGEWRRLAEGETLTFEYVYDVQSSKGPVGYFKIQLEKTGVTGASPDYEVHEATAACQPNGQPLSEQCTHPAETYTLKITYVADKLGERSRPSSTVHNGTKGPGTEVGTGNTLENGLGILEMKNVHEVHVISGSIEITKEFKEGLTDSKDHTFTFILHRVEDGEDTSKDILKTITIPANSRHGRNSIVFDKLRRGTYTVSEAVDENYMVKEIKVLDTTNCASEPEIGGVSDTVSFTMGNNINQENVIGKLSEEDRYTSYIDPVNGVYGAAKFTNKEIGFEGEIPVTKFWDDGAENHTGNEVYVVLYKDGSPLLDSDGNARILKLNASSNWKGFFTVVLADKEDVVTNYDYSVREVSSVSAEDLYGWHGAILENDKKTILYYEKALENSDVAGFGGNGYMVQYVKGENGAWTVENYHAVKLPATGGIGTKPYIFSGSLMVTAALIYGFILKRKEQRGRNQNPP